jgi:hypothetical protein
MNSSSRAACPRLSRRGFLLGAGTGLAAGVPLTLLGAHAWQSTRHTSPAPLVVPPTVADGMPGPYRGKVIETHHPASVGSDNAAMPAAVHAMVNRGMSELTGADLPKQPELPIVDAWRRFFQPGDVVGIKVNPVGRAYSNRQIPAISSHALVVEVVQGLRSVGIPPQDIVLFERYADQFREAGYDELTRTRPLDGVRWYAASAQYTNHQVDIEGYDGRRDTDRHVVGYDPDHFVQMPYAWYETDPKDDRRYRSHLTVVAARMVNKIINLPVLKDHGSGGVTLALKNLSHGLNNNVARSHLVGIVRDEGASAPNQCNTFIPAAVNQVPIKRKTVLHIMDGLIAVYEGGPASRHNWLHKSLFFATDPVALDMVGWRYVDAKRVEKGLPPVARTGRQFQTSGSAREPMDRRQPEHIILAGTVGLGTFDWHAIEHRRIVMA